MRVHAAEGRRRGESVSHSTTYLAPAYSQLVTRGGRVQRMRERDARLGRLHQLGHRLDRFEEPFRSRVEPCHGGFIRTRQDRKAKREKTALSIAKGAPV